jgi:hypothetical protein
VGKYSCLIKRVLLFKRILNMLSKMVRHVAVALVVAEIVNIKVFNLDWPKMWENIAGLSK